MLTWLEHLLFFAGEREMNKMVEARTFVLGDLVYHNDRWQEVAKVDIPSNTIWTDGGDSISLGRPLPSFRYRKRRDTRIALMTLGFAFFSMVAAILSLFRHG